jgi:hypothetical protein
MCDYYTNNEIIKEDLENFKEYVDVLLGAQLFLNDRMQEDIDFLEDKVKALEKDLGKTDIEEDWEREKIERLACRIIVED